MKTLGLIFLALFSTAHAEVAAVRKSKAKIPHLHDAQRGGHVFMAGDDHLEVVWNKKSQELHLFLSDKFRHPQSPELFDFEVALAGEGSKKVLSHEASSASPFEIRVKLPEGTSATTAFEVKMKRKSPTPGYVVASAPVKFHPAQLEAKSGHSQH